MSNRVELKVRLPRELHSEVKKVAEAAGISINDFVVKALQAYLSNMVAEDTIELDKVKHVIVSGSKEVYCYNCGYKLKPGYRAIKVPGKGLLCLICAAKLGVDKRLARYEMEIWKMKKLKKEIEKEINKLYEELTQLETLKKVEVYVKELRDVQRSLRQILSYDIWDKTKGCNELAELLNSIYEKIETISDELKILDTIMRKVKTLEGTVWGMG